MRPPTHRWDTTSNCRCYVVEHKKDLRGFMRFSPFQAELVGIPWQRAVAMSLSGWFGGVKSNWIYTAICSIRVFKSSQGVVCQSGLHLVTYSDNCQSHQLLLQVAQNVCSQKPSFPVCTPTIYPCLCALSVCVYVYTHNRRILYIRIPYLQNTTNRILQNYCALCPCL